jgi:hypothetical protein
VQTSLWLLYLLLPYRCLSQKHILKRMQTFVVLWYVVLLVRIHVSTPVRTVRPIFILSFFVWSLFTVWIFYIVTLSLFSTRMPPAQTFSRAMFLNTWVKINITQVKYILFQRKVEVRAGNGGRGRCSCLERNSVYLPILKHKWNEIE